MLNDPLVSIIMSVFNAAETLDEAIESVRVQSYSNWELVICDDASTDRTPSLLRQVVADLGDQRVILVTNDVNRRLAFSLNRCLDVARGEFIARMDADDIAEPDRLSQQMKYLQDHPDVDLVGTSMRRFNDAGLGDIVRPAAEEPNRWTMGRAVQAPFCHATIVARRRVFDKVGGYTVSWRTERGQDLDLWYKFFAAGLVGRNLAEPLYRVREDQAAVRRRTPRARLGSFVTRVRWSWRLRYAPRAYLLATVELLKILVPYVVVDWWRRRSAFGGRSRE